MTSTASPSPAASTLTPALPEGTVQVWLTLPDQSKKLQREPDLQFTGGGAAGGAVIPVDDSVLYQQMEGFGAAMTDSSAWLILNVLDEASRMRLMRNLFTREGDGIGLSYLRVPMGASDFARRDYTYDDLEKGQTDPELRRFNIEVDKTAVIPALKLAVELNPELGLMGSPWSAPAWMKRGERVEGGPLLEEYYGAFAGYHVKFVQAYAEQGLKIEAITPQNEPMYSTDGYPTMFISAAGQAKLVRDHLGPAFRAAGLDTQIIIFDHNWDIVQYPLEVLSDAEAAAYVDGVAFHCYGGDVSAQSQVHDAYPDKSIWFTECSGGGWADNWADNLNWNVRTLIIGNFRNWGNSVLLWNLALDENDGPQNGGCSNCRGVVTINQQTREVTYNEEYTILGHVSKFVDRGAYRIDSGAPGSDLPANVAFVNPDHSLVLIAQSDQERSFTVSWAGKSFAYTLPARSVVTFKWQGEPIDRKAATALPTRTPAPAGTPLPAGAEPKADLLLDFEAPGGIYADINAEASIGAVAHTGQGSLRSASAEGKWHRVGAEFKPAPLDVSRYRQLCFWVYDTTQGDTGTGDNTVGVRLLDSAGGSEERWSDHADVGMNPKTSRNQWVQMCINLSAFSQIDLTRLEAVEFMVYWAGDWYFDDVSVQGLAGNN
jgi:glucosylceramidase